MASGRVGVRVHVRLLAACAFVFVRFGCVRPCVFVHVHVCALVFVPICLCPYARALSVFVNECACVRASVHFGSCARVCIGFCAYLFVSICACIVRVCERMCLRVCVRACSCAITCSSIHVRLWARVRVRICVRVHLCAFACLVCVCVCVRVFVPVPLAKRKTFGYPAARPVIAWGRTAFHKSRFRIESQRGKIHRGPYSLRMADWQQRGNLI